MRKALFLTIAVLFGSGWLLGADVPITNPSFENPILADGVWNTSIPGWAISGSGGAGVWNPMAGQTLPVGNTVCPNDDPSQAFVGAVPNGSQVAWSNGGDLEQATGATITPGYRYRLKVFVGGRCSIYANHPYAVILAGNSPLDTKTGSNAADSWVEQTATYTSQPGDPNAGQTLKMRLVNYDGTQVDFDYVRFDASRVVTCQAFLPPFDQALTLRKKENRAVPVKMILHDLSGNVITDTDLSAPPVVDVTVNGQSVPFDGYNADLLPGGLSDDGNQFRYDPYAMQWIINLGTKQFTASGTYTVTAVPGDSSYVIDSTCTQTFARQ